MIEEKSGKGRVRAVSGEKPIRVALDATAIGRGKTGNETYLRGLLEGWERVKPEGIELWPILSEPSFASNLARSEGASKRVNAQSKQIASSGFFKRHLWDLPQARAKLKADLYHGVYWMRPWEKGPYVLTVHDISFAVHPEWFRAGEAKFYTTMIRRAAERARKVITVSEFCRREIMERWDLPADQVEATYEAARKVFQPGKKKAEGPPTLLFVSAIHPRKNLGRLIRVWERLKEGRFPDIRLRVVPVQPKVRYVLISPAALASTNAWFMSMSLPPLLFLNVSGKFMDVDETSVAVSVRLVILLIGSTCMSSESIWPIKKIVFLPKVGWLFVASFFKVK